MSGSMQGTHAEPNLTPVLDMVFQLITFFMLVINVKVSESDTSVHLPVLGAAVPSDSKEQKELIVINIASDGMVKVRGRSGPSVDLFIAQEAQAVIFEKKLEPGADLPVTIVIRADSTLKFESLMTVINSCQSKGFRQFDFMVIRGQSG